MKITVWFTAASIVVVLFAYLAVFAVSRQILIKTIQDCLVQAVENNVDEVEYLLPSSQALKEQRYDYLIRHGSGYLDIDDDFLYEVNEVYTGLYDEHSGLLYGSDSAFSIVAGMRFEDSRIQKLRSDGICLTASFRETVWTIYGFAVWCRRSRGSGRCPG